MLQGRVDVAIKISYKSVILFPDKFIYILLPIYHVQNDNSLRKTSNFVFISNFEKKTVSKLSTNIHDDCNLYITENASNKYFLCKNPFRYHIKLFFALRYPFCIPKIQYCDSFLLEYTTEVVIDCRDHRIRLVSSYCCFE